MNQKIITSYPNQYNISKNSKKLNKTNEKIDPLRVPHHQPIIPKPKIKQTLPQVAINKA